MKKKNLINLWLSFGLQKAQIEKIITKITLLSNSELFLIDEIDDKYIDNINNLFERFKKWEPFEYLLSNSEFYWFDFFVDNRVLIPRNDSEVMVFESLKEIEKTLENFILIDVWTWSSCIPISIVKNILSNTFLKNIFALDISLEALEVSRINIKKYSLENKVSTLESNLLSCFFDNNSKIFTENSIKNLIITANLPYIKDLDYKNMDYSVINYEPKIALYGWKKTWFEMYEELINQCFKLKKFYNVKEIVLFIEIWFDQYEYSKNYLSNLWLDFEYFRDNSWVFRCIKIFDFKQNKKTFKI